MARKTLPYHRRYQGDALQGYTKLTLEERGAYTTILDLIYDAGGPIEYNDRWLAGMLNCSLRKMRPLLSRLLTLQKIYLTDDGRIGNHRCDKELQASESNARKQSERRSRPNKDTAERVRDPYGFARNKSSKTGRKSVENELNQARPEAEKGGKPSKNNSSPSPDYHRRHTIPVPEPYIISSTAVDEDTGQAETGGSGTVEIAAVTSSQRLIDALEGRSDGKYRLQAQLQRGRRRGSGY